MLTHEWFSQRVVTTYLSLLWSFENISLDNFYSIEQIQKDWWSDFKSLFLSTIGILKQLLTKEEIDIDIILVRIIELIVNYISFGKFYYIELLNF